MTNTEITAFLTQNRATKAKAIVEILTKDDAAACLAAALQLLPGGDDRESVVELIVGLADIPTIRDALAIHAPNWGGAAAREMGRRAVRGDEVALSVIGAIAKADDGNGVSFAECFIDPHGDETPLRKWEKPSSAVPAAGWPPVPPKKPNCPGLPLGKLPPWVL